MEVHIDKFHNLGGKTMAEHNRNFNYFIQDLNTCEPDVINSFLDNLKPKNRQEELFRIKLFLHYKKEDKVLETFLEGDRVLCKIIVQHPLVIDIFNHMTADDFITKVTPKISYVTRTNLINKLATNFSREAAAEEYFTATAEKYGIEAAYPLLLSCSEDVIRENVSEYRILLNGRQLIYLHKKFGSTGFLHFYFQEIGRHKNNYFGELSDLARYLILNDVQSFHALYTTGDVDIGIRGFENFISVYKNLIVENPSKYRDIIKPKILFKHFSQSEATTFFKNIFPACVDDFYNPVGLKYLKHLQFGSREEVYLEAFKSLYGFEMFSKDHYSFKSHELMSLLPLEVRLKFKLDDDLQVFDKIENCIRDLKEQINTTSETGLRGRLVTRMFEACKINNDNEMLLEVLRYVQQRHKNDTRNVREHFMEYILTNFNVVSFGPEHWNIFEEFVLLFEINNDCVWKINDYYKACIQYKFLHGLDYSSDLKKFLAHGGPNCWSSIINIAELHKATLLNLVELIPILYTKPVEIRAARISFFENIMLYNDRNIYDEPISYYQFSDLLENLVRDLHYADQYGLIETILYYVPSLNAELKFREELLEDFMLCKKFSSKFLIWLLKFRPDVIIKHADAIMHCDRNISFEFFYKCSKMHYTPIPQFFCRAALRQLQLQDSETHLTCRALTILCFERDFLQLAESLVPKSDCVIDTHDPNMKNTLQIQTHVIATLKKVFKPSDCIEITLKFCKKDYLRLAVPLLYFVLYHSPEAAISAPISEIMDRAVSVRKHATFLATKVGSVHYMSKVLKTMMENEKNVSVQKFIFARNFQAFIHTASKEMWEILKGNLKFVSPKDTENFFILFHLDKIPRKFFSAYVEEIWRFAEQRGEKDEFRFISLVTGEMFPLLKDEFCDEVLRCCIDNKRDINSLAVCGFVYDYLMADQTKLEKRLNILLSYTEVPPEVPYREAMLHQKHIKTIFKRLCHRLIEIKHEKPTEAKNLIGKIETNIDELNFQKLDFELFLQSTRLYVSEPDFEVPLSILFSKQLKIITDQLGFGGIDFFVKYVKEFIDQIFLNTAYNTNELQLILAENILKHDASSANKLLVLNLLPPTVSDGEVLKQKHWRVIDMIKKAETHTVSIYLDKYLQDTYF